jgi:Lsr2
MARTIHVHLKDDIDGSDADETVRFVLDGVTYEIDLNADHASALRGSLAPWVAAARTVTSRGRVIDLRTGSRTQESAEIRRWATEAGLPVSRRGRLPNEVRARWEAARRG